MANIYHTINLLGELKTSDKLTLQEKQFITLLEGGENGDALLKFARTPFVQETGDYNIDNLEAKILAEINQTPNSHRIYKRALRSFLTELNNIQQKRKELANKSVQEKMIFDAMAARRDSIYEETTEKYNGTLLLPIHQYMEVRLGQSRGECFGYIAEWARCLLLNRAPFGVDPNINEPPFKFVRFQSAAGHKYPELNHLAVLTKNISTFQKNQSKIEKLTESIAATFLPSLRQGIAYKDIQSTKFLINKTDKLAEILIAKADANPDSIYNLNVMGYGSGHALGFCKIDNKYHFADSNFGWVRFDNAEDFKKWLPMFFEKMTYNKVFNEYMIRTYAIAPREVKQPPLSIPAAVVICVIASPILIPLAVVGVIALLGMLTYQFVIRGLIYAGINSSNKIKNKLSPKDKTPYHADIKLPERSLDTSDLPNTSKPEKTIAHCIPSTYSRVAGALDISSNDLKAAQERAANNPEFKRKVSAPVQQAQYVEESSDNDDSSNLSLRSITL